MSGGLAQHFLREIHHVDGERPTLEASISAAERAGLEHALARVIEDVERAWPGMPIEPAAFLGHVAARMQSRDFAGLLDELGRLHASDLYLALACIVRHGPAIAAFRARCLRDAERALMALGVPAEEIDDVRQLVLELLVIGGSGSPPRLVGYQGRGPLRRWTRSIALRMAARRRPRAHRGDDAALVEHLVDDSDPHPRAVLAGPHARAFKSGFEAALGALEPQQRNLLRYYYVDGLTVAKIAALLRVNASTVARRLAKVRSEVEDATRQWLVQHHDVATGEVDSLMRSVADLVDVSMHRLLGAEPVEP